MRPSIDDQWIEYFQKKGYAEARGISVGMEGAVYALIPNDLVAKVWSDKKISELENLQSIYNKLAHFSNDILTPRIVDIFIAKGKVVSIEQFLAGDPLEKYLDPDAKHPDKLAVSSVTKVLDFLRSVPAQDEFKKLSVLDEARPAWDGSHQWSNVINKLISSRLSRFGHLLKADVPNTAEIIEAVNIFIQTRDTVTLSLLHGDLCGPNIMVDKNLKPIAVFDFGFLSMIGDPLFDAGVTSSLFNMYGPSAESIDKEVTNIFSEKLGYDIKTLLAYKAVYALITSNAYGIDNTDGHYQWCVRMLHRKDVLSSLGL